jgi:hypothetical protein
MPRWISRTLPSAKASNSLAIGLAISFGFMRRKLRVFLSYDNVEVTPILPQY